MPTSGPGDGNALPASRQATRRVPDPHPDLPTHEVNVSPFLACMASLSLVLPQTPSSPPAGAPLASAAALLQSALRSESAMLFDQPEPDGAWWVRGSNFKAMFDDRGWTFVPQPPPDAVDLEPLRFDLAEATVGRVALAVATAKPSRSGQRLVYQHGALVETLDVDGNGVEQRFVFAALPERGELQIALRTSGLSAHATAAGIEFASSGGPVTYSTAIAIDAAGRRVTAPTTWAGDRIVIRVPAAFVADAVLPLTIDPRVAYAVPATAVTDLADPDVCIASVTGWPIPAPSPYLVWSIVYANYFGASDWDCFVQRYDPNLQPVGTPLVIDTTIAGWSRPRIASQLLAESVLVVAQVRTGSSLFRIRGRSASYISNYPAVQIHAPFDIMADFVDCTHPDVGGSAVTPFLTPAYTVVWERAYSSTDHDILARRIHSDDSMDPAFTIDADAAYQSNPSISKSVARTDLQTQASEPRLGIVFQQTASLGNQDVYCALLDGDGQHVLVNNNSVFPIDTSGHNDINPAISTAARLPDGSRRLLVAYERTTSGGGDIMAAGLRGDGTILGIGNVSALEGDSTRLPWPQRRPSVDSDGRRFAVAYQELYLGDPVLNDIDTRVSLVGIGVNGLVVEEPGAILSYSSDREINVEIASQFGGVGYGPNRYCAVNDRDTTGGTFAIDVRTYDAQPALSVTTRATACGTTLIAYSGRAEIGQTLSLLVVPTAPFTGVMIGDTVSVPFPGCAGCTLGVGNAVLVQQPHNLVIPNDATLIGIQLSAQGVALVASGGTCLGWLQFTDTLDFRVQ